MLRKAGRSGCSRPHALSCLGAGKEGEGGLHTDPTSGTCICILVGSAFEDHRNGWSRLRLLEPVRVPAHPPCRLGQTLNLSGLIPFSVKWGSLAGASAGERVVCPQCLLRDGTWQGGRSKWGGTSIANPRDRASSAVAPARSPAPTGKGASPLSLGVRGGLELCARPAPREDPHSTPPGGRWSLDVEEETGVHPPQQLSPRPPSPARHQTDPPPVGGCGTTPRTKSVETRPSSRAGVGAWQSGVTLGDRHHLLVVPSPPDRQADARRRHPASASLVGAPAGPTPQASREPFPPGPAPDMAVGRQGQARERVTAAREPRCGLR